MREEVMQMIRRARNTPPRKTKPPDWDRWAVVIAAIQVALDVITRFGR
jgi:hypothetical protein